MYPTVGAFAQYKKMVTGSCFEQKLPENYASKAEFNLQNLTQPSDNIDVNISTVIVRV